MFSPASHIKGGNMRIAAKNVYITTSALKDNKAMKSTSRSKKNTTPKEHQAPFNIFLFLSLLLSLSSAFLPMTISMIYDAYRFIRGKGK